MKVRKSHILIFLSILFIVVVLAAIQYYHFRGVKDSLERLVGQRSGGRYQLDLGKTSYDFIRLDFTLKNARIHRIDTLKKTKIYSVELPFVRINLGSLESYFSFGQINVKEFVIEEPVVVLHKEQLERKQLQLSGELSNLLNIVREILDTYNIHSFKINKGSFTLNNKSEQIRISLIDFLAKEWNVRRLTKESQIKIDVGGQRIQLAGHQFSFNQIEYSYLKRQLLVNDFSYRHRDSLTNARLNVNARQLIVYHIDWDELSNAERYKLKKIELIEPQVNGAFPAMKKSSKSTAEFSKMLYSTIGELAIDSVTVRNARVHLAYKQTDDSTSVSFKNASFNVTNFKLVDTNELFEVGEVRFNLNQTELIIGSKLKLRFDSLFFNHYLDRRLYVEGVQLSQHNASKPFLTSRQVVLNHFDALVFLMEKKIKAEQLELDDVKLTLLPALRTLSSTSSSHSSGVDVDLDRFRLSNAKLDFTNEQMALDAENVNIRAHDIHFRHGKKPVFKFDQLNVASIQFNHQPKQVDAQLRDVLIKERNITAAYVRLRQAKAVNAELNGVDLKLDSLVPKLPSHLPQLHVQNARVNVSSLPVFSGDKSKKNDFRLDQLVVDTLAVQLLSKENKLHFNATRFNVTGIETGSSPSWKNIQGYFEKVSFENEKWKVKAIEANINSEMNSILHALSIEKKDSTILIDANDVLVPPFDEHPYLSRVVLRQTKVKVHQRDIHVNGTMDSVVVNELKWAEKEKVHALQLYYPIVELKAGSTQRTKRRALSWSLPEVLGEMDVVNGEMKIISESNPIFVHGIDVNWKKGQQPLLMIDSANVPTAKNKFNLKRLSLTPDHISVGTLAILPRQSFEEYSTTGIERDLLKFNFGEIKATGYNLDSLIQGKSVRLNELNIGSFQIDVMKDKRLPDGPYKVKPLIAQFINDLPIHANVSVLKFNNGSVIINQISDKTNETGALILNNIHGNIKNVHSPLTFDKKMEMNADVQVFGQGLIKVNYVIDSVDRFKFDVSAERIDFATFNRIVQPLHSVRFKSGRLRKLRVTSTANDTIASGNTLINYQDLRIEITNGEKTNLRNEIISAVANELIKNKRKDTEAEFVQERDRSKAEFAYWVKIIFRGASGAARHGKRKR